MPWNEVVAMLVSLVGASHRRVRSLRLLTRSHRLHEKYGSGLGAPLSFSADDAASAKCRGLRLLSSSLLPPPFYDASVQNVIMNRLPWNSRFPEQ